jgi:diguanylate cyclase (GGDEF)-like protein
MTVAGSPRRFSVLVGAVVAIAALCYAAAVVAAFREPVPPMLAVTECVVLLSAGALLHVTIRLGAQRVELSWAEAAIVLGLAVAPAAWVILIMPIAVLVRFAGRQPVIKTVYNVASNTTAAGAAATLLFLANTDRPFTGTELLALTAAGAVAGLVTYLAVAIVIATVQDVPLFATWRASGGLQVLTLAGNLGVAIGLLELAHYQPLAVAAVPVIGLCLHQGYVGRLRGHQEREAGQRHAAAVGRLTADLDEPGVLRRSAEGACQLVSADVVEVELPGKDSSCAPVLYRHSRRGESWTGNPANAPAVPAQLVATLPIPVTDGRDAGQLRVWLASTAPDIRLGQGEEAALRSLATHTGAAVSNARLHAQQTYYATHDRLTGLPARPLLVERIEAPLRSGTAADCPPSALIVVALTGYGEMVRTLGHDVGEDLLIRTARRLEAAVSDSEFVAHVGADNFAVHLRTAISPAHVSSRALWLITAVTRAVRLDTTDLPTTQLSLRAVAGAAYSPTPVGSGTELLRQASVALERARARNINVDFYDPAADELGGPVAVVMRSELHAALEHQQLDLHYQPIIHLPSGAPVGLEALLRWYHPTKGLLYAGNFMAILERSPDHARFVAWQLDRALATRRRCGDRNLPISVNLAARCLLDNRFPEQVSAALDRAGVAPDQLMLEIDEADPLLTQAELVNEALTELRQRGVKIAIDRLGTGVSSLSGLLRVPATHVKVDGYFVRKMLADPGAAAVVGLGLDLSRHAELQFVGTGVDAEDQVAVLRQRGCTTAQGPHLARPMLADELPGYLADTPEAPLADDNVVSLDSHRRMPTL